MHAVLIDIPSQCPACHHLPPDPEHPAPKGSRMCYTIYWARRMDQQNAYAPHRWEQRHCTCDDPWHYAQTSIVSTPDPVVVAVAAPVDRVSGRVDVAGTDTATDTAPTERNTPVPSSYHTINKNLYIEVADNRFKIGPILDMDGEARPLEANELIHTIARLVSLASMNLSKREMYQLGRDIGLGLIIQPHKNRAFHVGYVMHNSGTNDFMPEKPPEGWNPFRRPAPPKPAEPADPTAVDSGPLENPRSGTQFGSCTYQYIGDGIEIDCYLRRGHTGGHRGTWRVR